MHSITEEDLKVIFDNSYSYKLYNEFNENANDENELKKNYCSKIDNSQGKNSELADICIKLARNLSKINTSKNRKGLCLHFVYWIYDKIWKLTRNNSNNNFDITLINELYNVGKFINKNYISYPCPYYYCNQNILKDWNEEKMLHDYIMNFDNVVSNYCSKQENKKNVFENYINYMRTIYPKHKKDCCPYMDNNCSEYFSCDDVYNPEKFFSQLACNGDKAHVITDSEKYDWIYRGEHKYFRCTEMEDKNDFKYSLCSELPYNLSVNNNAHESPKREKVWSYRGSQKGNNILLENKKQLTTNKKVCEINLGNDESGKCIEPDVRETGAIGYQAENADSQKMIRFLSSITSGSSASSREESNIMNNTFTRIGASTLLVAGVSLILFLYYKFTPFGSMMRRKILMKSGDKYNDKKYLEDYAMGDVRPNFQKKLSNRAQKNTNVNKQRGRTRITYHPT
ncbi:variable surface protein [Plasmodium gonderi]|uniref:Variable surface protein n=1 Tax=Plasmodium gonderi TaxID=77519 RepID=A0A1Y1JA71_PLAGO|nr:variable surface protein [Plasmodium gonderi]GAW79409.1 variable surface protein [Plasmodium gonderi]